MTDDLACQLERLVMLDEITETIGYEWHKCPFEFGTEEYVTIQSEHVGRLILMRIERFSGTNRGGIRATPVLHASMPTHKG